MKLLISSLLLISFALISSCAEKIVNVETPNESSEMTETPPPVVQQLTITGKFKSVTGVMDELSCYCSYGGYVTAEDGVVTALCFEEEVESCDKITVTGYMTSRSIEANGACPEGIMGFLKAQSYVVGETDY